jgi:hypothetical protein
LLTSSSPLTGGLSSKIVQTQQLEAETGEQRSHMSGLEEQLQTETERAKKLEELLTSSSKKGIHVPADK